MSSDCMSVISEMGDTSSKAATLGNMFYRIQTESVKLCPQLETPTTPDKKSMRVNKASWSLHDNRIGELINCHPPCQMRLNQPQYERSQTVVGRQKLMEP